MVNIFKKYVSNFRRRYFFSTAFIRFFVSIVFYFANIAKNATFSSLTLHFWDIKAPDRCVSDLGLSDICENVLISGASLLAVCRVRGTHSASLRSALLPSPASSLRENLYPAGTSHFPRPWAGHVPTLRQPVTLRIIAVIAFTGSLCLRNDTPHGFFRDYLRVCPEAG